MAVLLLCERTTNNLLFVLVLFSLSEKPMSYFGLPEHLILVNENGDIVTNSKIRCGTRRD